MIVIGIDAHKRSHTLVAVDASGAKLGERTVAANSAGHAEALRWAFKAFGTDLLWGVEDVRMFTRLLEHDLMAAKQSVARVPPTLMARSRKSSRTWGKSDPIDAAAVARALLSEPDLPIACHDEVSWELKLLVGRREDLVHQRVALTNRLSMRLHLIDPSRQQSTDLKWKRRRKELENYLVEQPGLLAEMAREELSDVGRFSENINTLTKRISTYVHDLGSTLPDIPGCAELTAAKLICEAANVTRFRDEAAFGRYVGIAPVPEWSGSTRGRLRLTRGGNRQLNAALHRIAVVQIRLDGPGRDFYRRRLADGDTPRNAIRCLKRRICRKVYYRLRAEYESRQRQPKPPAPAITATTPAWMHSAHYAHAIEHGGRSTTQCGWDSVRRCSLARSARMRHVSCWRPFPSHSWRIGAPLGTSLSAPVVARAAVIPRSTMAKMPPAKRPPHCYSEVNLRSWR